MLYYKQLCLSLFVILTLSACQAITTSQLVEQTQPQLDRIEIGQANTRYEQIFYRQLRDNLNQSSALRDMALSTELTLSSSNTLAVKGKSSDLSKAQMTLKYVLKDRLSGDIITNGTLKATATSGTVTSYYGQDKSKQFAAERLTRQLADKMVLTLRRYFLQEAN